MNSPDAHFWKGVRLALVMTALIVVMVLAIRPTLAQSDVEATPEPPPVVVTVVPNVIPGDIPDSGDDTIIVPVPLPDVNTPPRPLIDTSSILTLIGALVSAILLGGGGLMVLSNFLAKKEVQDVVEGVITAQPEPTQQAIEMVKDALQVVSAALNRVADFAEKVTDQKPNVETVVAPSMPMSQFELLLDNPLYSDAAQRYLANKMMTQTLRTGGPTRVVPIREVPNRFEGPTAIPVTPPSNPPAPPTPLEEGEPTIPNEPEPPSEA